MYSYILFYGQNYILGHQQDGYTVAHFDIRLEDSTHNAHQESHFKVSLQQLCSQPLTMPMTIRFQAAA